MSKNTKQQYNIKEIPKFIQQLTYDSQYPLRIVNPDEPYDEEKSGEIETLAKKSKKFSILCSSIQCSYAIHLSQCEKNPNLYKVTDTDYEHTKEHRPLSKVQLTVKYHIDRIKPSLEKKLRDVYLKPSGDNFKYFMQHPPKKLIQDLKIRFGFDFFQVYGIDKLDQYIKEKIKKSFDNTVLKLKKSAEINQIVVPVKQQQNEKLTQKKQKKEDIQKNKNIKMGKKKKLLKKKIFKKKSTNNYKKLYEMNEKKLREQAELLAEQERKLKEQEQINKLDKELADLNQKFKIQFQINHTTFQQQQIQQQQQQQQQQQNQIEYNNKYDQTLTNPVDIQQDTLDSFNFTSQNCNINNEYNSGSKLGYSSGSNEFEYGQKKQKEIYMKMKEKEKLCNNNTNSMSNSSYMSDWSHGSTFNHSRGNTPKKSAFSPVKQSPSLFQKQKKQQEGYIYDSPPPTQKKVSAYYSNSHLCTEQKKVRNIIITPKKNINLQANPINDLDQDFRGNEITNKKNIYTCQQEFQTPPSMMNEYKLFNNNNINGIQNFNFQNNIFLNNNNNKLSISNMSISHCFSNESKIMNGSNQTSNNNKSQFFDSPNPSNFLVLSPQKMELSISPIKINQKKQNSEGNERSQLISLQKIEYFENHNNNNCDSTSLACEESWSSNSYERKQKDIINQKCMQKLENMFIVSQSQTQHYHNNLNLLNTIRYPENHIQIQEK